jgi:hypothetical protein
LLESHNAVKISDNFDYLLKLKAGKGEFYENVFGFGHFHRGNYRGL